MILKINLSTKWYDTYNFTDREVTIDFDFDDVVLNLLTETWMLSYTVKRNEAQEIMMKNTQKSQQNAF